jgi:hypothetical protein
MIAAINMEKQTNVVTPKKGMSTTTKVVIGIGGCIVLVIVVVVGLLGLGLLGAAKVVNDIQEQNEQATQNADKKFNEPKALNTTVTMGSIAWTVTKAENLGTTIKAVDQYSVNCTAKLGTSFVHMTVKIKNNGKEEVGTFGLTLLDKDKKEYYTYFETYTCMGSTANIYSVENIGAGVEKTYDAYFEIPSSTKDLRLQINDLQLGTTELDYLSLGL